MKNEILIFLEHYQLVRGVETLVCLAEQAVGRMVYRPNGMLAKWNVSQMAVGQMGCWPNGLLAK